MLNFLFFPQNILSWDVFGYYLYLPFQFIYHDLGLKDPSIIHEIVLKYHNTDTLYQIVGLPEGGFVMKYSMGTSFFYAPFFFIGHAIALAFNFPADGFSTPYQYSIFFGQIIYSILGVWFLSKVLLRFFTEKIVAIVLIFIVFATNFPLHIAMFGQNAMSHNILFFTYALILWLTIKWHETNKLKYIVGLAIFCGLSILSRPSELVCLLIPLLWNVKNGESLKAKIALFIKHKWQICLFTLVVVLIGTFQLIYWKIYVGKFFYNSYGGNAGEGFESLNPYLRQVLFSFRKGWLIYTPIMIFAIIGFISVFRKNSAIFAALFVYFLLNLYIVSSWSCWWYAQSYSQRALIPSYPIMAIALGYFLVWLFNQHRWLKTSIMSLMVLLLVLNIFQIKQFINGVIDGDRMTKAYYFKTFGKLHVTDDDRKLLLVNRSFDGEEKLNNIEDYKLTQTLTLDFEKLDNHDSTFAHSGKFCYRLDSAHIYSKGIEKTYQELTNKDHFWLKIKGWVYPIEDIISNPFSFVVQFTHKDFPYKYKTIDSDKVTLKLNEWNELSMEYLSPEVRKSDDILKIYFWLRGSHQLYVDDIKVEVYEKR
jgi:hypothetical protein